MVGADLVVLWGINAAYTHINVMTLVKQARARGAHVVCIDPYRTPTAQQADEHLMVRPGTDGGAGAGHDARADAARSCVDHAYIERATLGFDGSPQHVSALAARARGADHRAPGGRDRRASRAATARRRASFLRVGIGLSRHENGGMTCRTIACLPALTGAYAHPHGGALLSSGGAVRPRRHGAGAAGPHARAAAAHDQHDPARARAHRSGPGAAGEGALRLQLEPGRDLPRPGAGAARASPCSTSAWLGHTAAGLELYT